MMGRSTLPIRSCRHVPLEEIRAVFDAPRRLPWGSPERRRAAPKPKDNGVSCMMDVVVDTRNQFGVLAGLETYHKEIVLHEGVTFSDDFSTRIRF